MVDSWLESKEEYVINIYGEMMGSQKKTMRMFAVAALTTAIILSGCASAPSATKKSESGGFKASWIFDEEGFNNSTLQKNEIALRKAPGEEPAYTQDVQQFGKVSWLYAFLERSSLHTKLNMDQKKQLLSYLFDEIPTKETADYYRAVAIGGYFDDNTPLMLYARAYAPSATAPSGAAVVLALTGNFVATQDAKTGEISLRPIRDMVAPRFNYTTVGVLFSDGRLIPAQFLYTEKQEKELKAEGDAATVAGNLADLYTKDELPENDAKIEDMLKNALAEESASEGTKTLLMLNLYQYYLYAGRFGDAEQALAGAMESGKTLDNPSFREVLDIQAPQMLGLME